VSIEKPGGRELKRKVLALLESDHFEEGLNELCRLPARKVINPLFSSLLSTDERTRWRAVTAMGAVVAHLAKEDTESARVIMRRLMWTLNDESGGIGWGAPEAMGEIMASHERLAREYVNVLISYVNEDGNFLEYEPLQRGAVWAVGRVAQVRPDLAQDAVPHLCLSLGSPDAAIRGLAVWALGLLRAEAARPQVWGLLQEGTEVSLYCDGNLVRRPLRDLAKEALARMDNKDIP
jgi:hypothetical protein